MIAVIVGRSCFHQGGMKKKLEAAQKQLLKKKKKEMTLRTAEWTTSPVKCVYQSRLHTSCVITAIKRDKSTDDGRHSLRQASSPANATPSAPPAKEKPSVECGRKFFVENLRHAHIWLLVITKVTVSN